MAENSIPWPDTGGVTGDGREYTSNEWSQIWELLWQEVDSTDQGYVPGAWNKLAVTAPAANTIRVATGAALVHGHAYWNTANLDLTPASAPAGQTRKDTVILRCDWAGAAQYTVRAVAKAGDAVNYPSLTQVDDNTWEIPLANYIIDDAGAITDLADRREPIYHATMVSTAMLDDVCVTEGKIGALAVTEGKIGALAVTEGKIGAGAVTNTKLGAGAVTAAKTACYSRVSFVWHMPGEAATGQVTLEYPVPYDVILTGGYIICPTAPTGADLILDVHSGAGAGVTIWTVQANRPKIAAGATGPTAVTCPDVVNIAAGTRLFCVVDQIGSGDPGEDWTLVLAGKTALID